MSSRALQVSVVLLAAASLALTAAPPHRRGRLRHPHPKPMPGRLTTLVLAPGNNLSLSVARAESGASSPEGPRFKLRLVLTGGGQKTWVSESCNPVVPIVNGEMRPIRQCITDFYAKVAAVPGRDEPLEFIWPIGDNRPLKAGDSVRLMMTLGSDCEKTTGPGLYAFGDCKTREQVLSSAFTIRE